MCSPTSSGRTVIEKLPFPLKPKTTDDNAGNIDVAATTKLSEMSGFVSSETRKKRKVKVHDEPEFLLKRIKPPVDKGVKEETNVSGYKGSVDANGLPQGEGVRIYPSGNVHNGNWRHGVRNGEGFFQMKNGDVYFSEFEADRPQGPSVVNAANGDYCEGVWKNEAFIPEGNAHLTLGQDAILDLKFKKGLMDPQALESLEFLIKHQRTLQALKEKL